MVLRGLVEIVIASVSMFTVGGKVVHIVDAFSCWLKMKDGR